MRFLKHLAMSVAITALAAPQLAAAQQKTYKIGAAVYGLKGEFMPLWANALKEHPAVKDGTVKLTIFDGKYDALTQNNQFDTMVTKKVRAFGCWRLIPTTTVCSWPRPTARFIGRLSRIAN